VGKFRDRKWGIFVILDNAALDYIEQQANHEGEAPAEWMLNKRVEVDQDGSAKHRNLPDDQ
jgi:hypothetical protein